MTEQAMIAKYPLSDNAKLIIESKEILAMLMKKPEYTGMVSEMCKDNYKLSKKMAKVHIKAINKIIEEEFEKSIKNVRSFLLIKDSLQQLRLEWVIGISQIASKDINNPKYGIELATFISDNTASYES